MKHTKTVRYGATVARILLALTFFIFGIIYFFMPEMPLNLATPAGKYMAGLLASGYFMPFLKSVETICGLALFSKRWTPLALLILAPIIIQICFYDIFLDQSGLIIGIVVALLAAFLAWFNWDKYSHFFKA